MRLRGGGGKLRKMGKKKEKGRRKEREEKGGMMGRCEGGRASRDGMGWDGAIKRESEW